jgi:hypothetical protein
MLEGLTISRRPGSFVFVGVNGPVEVGDGIEAVLTEDEGTTVVATTAVADRRGWRYDFVAAWLTLDIHSDLEAIGLTAAFSSALAEAGIPCNVLAGLYHDHLLVPAIEADRAVECLESLARQQRHLRTEGVSSVKLA